MVSSGNVGQVVPVAGTAARHVPGVRVSRTKPEMVQTGNEKSG